MARRSGVNWRAEAAKAARREGVPVGLFVAQIEQESAFDEDVIFGRRVSSAGAQGIAQIMPATARGWGVNPLKPRKALRAAAQNMKKYIDAYGEEGALRAYNAGPGAIAASRGYAETNQYVNNIMRNRKKYAGLAAGAGVSRGGDTGATRDTPARTVAGYKAQNMPAAAAASPEVQELSAELAAAAAPRVGVTAPALPSFAASARGPQGQSLSVPSVGGGPVQGPRMADTLAAAAMVQQGPTVQNPDVAPLRIPGTRGSGGRGPVLVVGDSLGVGTAPLLKRAVGGRVESVVKGGISSSRAVAAARGRIASGRFGTIVFDLGTNDASAKETVASLREVARLAPNSRIVVATVNSPWDEGRKNRALRTIARNMPNVELVRWHGASRGGAILSDGIHGAYDKRAALFAQAVGPAGGGGAGGGGAAAPGLFKPAGGYKGTKGIADRVVSQLGKGLGLTVTSSKRHNTNPHSGKGSDHDYGNTDAYATDVSNGSAPTPQMDEFAFRIMRALGDTRYKKGQPIDTSRGVFTVNGVRVQVIYRGDGAAFGGNHLNHVHVGYKRAG